MENTQCKHMALIGLIQDVLRGRPRLALRFVKSLLKPRASRRCSLLSLRVAQRSPRKRSLHANRTFRSAPRGGVSCSGIACKAAALAANILRRKS